MSRVVRVTHVVYSMDVGGLERNVLNHVRLAREMGEQLSVLCIAREGRLAASVRDAGARLVSVGKLPGLRPGVLPRVRATLRDLAPDVVHTHQIGASFYAGLAAIGLGIPLLVHTEHGHTPYAARHRTRLLGRIAGRSLTRFYCLTEDMAQSVVTEGIVPADKIRIIRNGIDAAPFRRRERDTDLLARLGIPSDAPVVGTVGRLAEVKKQEVLIRSFAALLGLIPSAHLLVIGAGPEEAALRALVLALGLRLQVHFLGYMSDPTPALHLMTCFVLSSRSEGMPQSLLEAAVAGVPVVASRVGGVASLIDHGTNGLLFPAGDTGALTEAVIHVIRNPQRAGERAERLRQRVESEFTVTRMAREYHEDYLRLLHSHSIPRDALPSVQLGAPAD